MMILSVITHWLIKASVLDQLNIHIVTRFFTAKNIESAECVKSMMTHSSRMCFSEKRDSMLRIRTDMRINLPDSGKKLDCTAQS